MKPVVIHEEASGEALQIINYYDNIRADLGIAFEDALQKALTRIQSNPFMYAAEIGSIRICPIHDFPYLVYYDNRPEDLWVVAVAHHHRRPKYWLYRLPKK